MASNFLSPAAIKQLDLFVKFVKNDLQVLYKPELKNFKQFLEELDAKLPPKKEEKIEEEVDDMPPLEEETTKKPTKSEKFEEVPAPEEPEEPEQPEEKDPDLITPDNDLPQEMGDENAQISEAMMDEAQEAKNKAQEALSNGDFAEAAIQFTVAIKKNPKSSLIYANRANCYLKLKKPNAAIRDCNQALKLNPDSGKAYKVRGKAYRYIGNYEQSAKDFRVGLKLDYDDESYQMQQFVEQRFKVQQERQKKRDEHARKKSEKEKKIF